MPTFTTVDQLSVEGQRAFVRLDLNTPLTPSGEVADDSRILAALPTVRSLIERGARIVLASHLGRPKGAVRPELSLEPVASRLAEKLGCEVRLTDEPVGDGARKVVSDLRDGQVALLENLRFHPGEVANDPDFAKTLGSYADVYVNDAFGAAHRAHASIVGVVEHVSKSAAGFLLAAELNKLGRLLSNVERPYVAIIGGAKISGKIDVLEALLSRVQRILIGGAMANTFLLAQGLNVGKSLVEPEKLAVARSFLRQAKSAGVDILLPTDVVVAPSIDADGGTVVPVSDIAEDQLALDIGPSTLLRYADAISAARTLFWNGPMGVFERPAFAEGTVSVARAVADNQRCFSVVGGGDSAAAVVAAGVRDAISHVSTGGGASLEYIQGIQLPGVLALENA